MPARCFYQNERGIAYLNTGVAGQNIFIFIKVPRFGFAVQIPNYKEYTKQKMAVCGLLRSAGLARAPAASRRERARGAKRTASKAWPIPTY